MYDLIIVGGGPAGLAAAVYGIRKRLNVLLVSQDLGGKTNMHLELADGEIHYVIRGVDLVRRFRSELDYLDFVRAMENVVSLRKVEDNFIVRSEKGTEWEARAVIWATGTRVRKLGAPGEERYTGKGLVYSAVSYAPLFLDRCATVVGGGKLAVRAAAELARVAAAVHLVAPEHGYLSTPLAQKLAHLSNVVIWDSYHVKEIDGNGAVERVIIQSPQGQETVVETEGVFVEIGLIPNSEPVQGLVALDEEGRVEIDSLNRTSCPGLFAAGDVTNTYAEQVLVAVGEGVKAALSAADYLL
jgi:thioredoxin reductase